MLLNLFFSLGEQQLGLYRDVGLLASFLWQKREEIKKRKKKTFILQFQNVLLEFHGSEPPLYVKTELLVPCGVALKVGLHRQFHTDCECLNLLGCLSRTMVRNTNVCPFGSYFEVKQILKEILIWETRWLFTNTHLMYLRRFRRWCWKARSIWLMC